MYRIISITIWTLIIFFCGFSHALEIPPPTGFVNDFAGLLTKEEVAKISRDLELYKASTSNDIRILIVENLQGLPISEFSIKVAEAWKIGKKGKDNGIIITIAKSERKIRIEAGRGLEGRLTDAVTGQIIRKQMKPSMKDWKTAEALSLALPQIKLAIRGEFKADDSSKEAEELGTVLLACFLFFILIIAGAIFGLISSVLTGCLGAPFLGGIFFGLDAGPLLILAFIGTIAGFAAYCFFRMISSGFGGGGSGGDSGSSFGGGFGNGGGTGASGDGGSFGGAGAESGF